MSQMMSAVFFGSQATFFSTTVKASPSPFVRERSVNRSGAFSSAAGSDRLPRNKASRGKTMPASRMRTFIRAPWQEHGTCITLPASGGEATASLVLLDELNHGEGDGEEDVAVAVEVGHLDRPPRRLLDPRPDPARMTQPASACTRSRRGLPGRCRSLTY